MKKKIVICISIFTAVLIVRLFGGVYEHDEFVESYFFIKHRPTWKWKFYSPIGMSDIKLEELNEEKQTEQKYFNEFVRDHRLSQ